MAVQALVIGLGQFGMSLAKALAEKNVEVLAVDRRRDLVEEAAVFADEAVCTDATDETELAKLRPGQRDVAICAIGDDSREASIICTALLRQMGTPSIIARAHSPTHQRILKLVGAHTIVNPEYEFGRRLAGKLVLGGIVSNYDFSTDGIDLVEIDLPHAMEGKTLSELELPKRFGVTVGAVRRKNEPKPVPPNPREPFLPGDRILLICGEDSLTRFMKGVRS